MEFDGLLYAVWVGKPPGPYHLWYSAFNGTSWTPQKTVPSALTTEVSGPALAVYHGVIPPTPHFERANPALGIEQTPFFVSPDAQAWPSGSDERWAGVSSFGIGGTNVHLCLRSVAARAEAGREAGPWVFTLSAKTASALGAPGKIACA